MHASATQHIQQLRRQWLIQGQVQGVGFRPFVYRLARELQLQGYVRNDGQGVTVEAQGAAKQLARFERRLQTDKPGLAVIDSIYTTHVTPNAHEDGFIIVHSEADGATARVTIDTALCDMCKRELLDPIDRRHGYALINCTHCGPRYSIVNGIPYDRPNTTMAGFDMCPDCEDEYTDPADRRYHAQPIACHACGPTLQLLAPTGDPFDADPIARAAELLLDGGIVAIKGLGGFHLAVRADDENAVQRLRQRKQRDAKPFAVMVRDIDAAKHLARLSDEAAKLLRSAVCPIVLAEANNAAALAQSIAPGVHRVGLMLPYTPIHHLLYAAEPRLNLLVMTSANLTDEPLVIDNDEAVERLGGLCDALLLHDRPIARRVDDSVVIDMPDAPPLPIRRARGYAPAPLRLPIAADEPGLCVGGELKNTVAVVRGDEVILSQHLGDLKHPLALEAFEQAVHDLMALFEVQPRWVACDAHPLYLSTQRAKRWAEQWGVPLIEVQHHHAHAAALLAEHRMTEPILAAVCDGVGYGDDGGVWGGELLLAGAMGYRRLAHLRPLRLPGGDAAARDTRRCALALLYQAFGDDFADHPVALRLYPSRDERTVLATMIKNNVRCAESTAAGRVFDGVAALLGLCSENRHEAEAPMKLEAAASMVGQLGVGLKLDAEVTGDVIDLAPMVRQLLVAEAKGSSKHELAAAFHAGFADAWAELVGHAAATTGVRCVGLTGGVFCNERLTTTLSERLTAARLRVLRHEAVPPNDGGLALGQAYAAIDHLKDTEG